MQLVIKKHLSKKNNIKEYSKHTFTKKQLKYNNMCTCNLTGYNEVKLFWKTFLRSKLEVVKKSKNKYEHIDCLKVNSRNTVPAKDTIW